MYQVLLHDALSADRRRGDEARARAEYVRRLAVVRRRQRRTEQAHRALSNLVVR